MIKKMTIKPETSGVGEVKNKTRCILWAKAAGRCQYQGCNEPLIGDLISGDARMNSALIAHIIAGKATGPRGDLIRSPKLVDDVRNLMLLCHKHHCKIDIEDVEGHPEGRLLDMKSYHEQRMKIVSGISEDQQTHIVHYGANIGKNEAPLSYQKSSVVVLPDHYPAEGRSVDLQLIGSQSEDHENNYWHFQQENLHRQFKSKIRGRIETGEIRHMSVFAIAPQPLLIELGRLLSDINHVAVHQLKREPAGWGWLENRSLLCFESTRGKKGVKHVALKLALSATINDERINSVLGKDVSIWSITVKNPHNNIMVEEQNLSKFRTLLRKIYDDIKASHGEDICIHIFPALPVSAAVEVGRVWMPKADLPLRIYDENKTKGGFIEALTIETVLQN